MRNGVDAKPVDALIKPPAHHVVDGGAHLVVFPVEIGLTAAEQVHEILAGHVIPLPGRAAENRFPVIRLRPVLAVTPDIPVAFGVIFRGARFEKPRVLVRGMIHDQVENQPHAALMHALQQPVEIGHGAELRHDPLIVADVVPVIVVGRRVHRADPDKIDAEIFQVIELFNNPVEIANTVAVAVFKAARINLVGRRLFPPAAFYLRRCFTHYPS